MSSNCLPCFFIYPFFLSLSPSLTKGPAVTQVLFSCHSVWPHTQQQEYSQPPTTVHLWRSVVPSWTIDHGAATFTYAYERSHLLLGQACFLSEVLRSRGEEEVPSPHLFSPEQWKHHRSWLHPPRPPHPAPHHCIYQWPAWFLAKCPRHNICTSVWAFWSLVRFPSTSTTCHLTNYYLLPGLSRYWSCLLKILNTFFLNPYLLFFLIRNIATFL